MPKPIGATGINGLGQIAGCYYDTSDNAHGYLRRNCGYAECGCGHPRSQ